MPLLGWRSGNRTWPRVAAPLSPLRPQPSHAALVLWLTRVGSGLARPELLCVDVDDERAQQDKAADQDLEEAIDVDMVQTVVEHAQHEQAHNSVADAALAAKQAGAAHHDGRDGVEQVVVKLVLLRAA